MEVLSRASTVRGPCWLGVQLGHPRSSWKHPGARLLEQLWAMTQALPLGLLVWGTEEEEKVGKVWPLPWRC